MQILRTIVANRGGSSRLAMSSLLIGISLSVGVSAWAQSSATQSEQEAGLPAAAGPVIPQQMRYSGKVANRAGQTVDVVFSVYAVKQDGEPLWTEMQRITVGEDGSYSVLLGSADPKGLPQGLFAEGAARWLGVSVERAPEMDRVLLASVPYAMKSADAEALAGHAAADFVTQEQLTQLEAQHAQAPAFTPNTTGTVTGSGTAGAIPMWTGALTQGNSEMVQVGSEIGINEATPAATLDVGGTGMIRGTLTLPAAGTATSTAGVRSQLLQLSASAWSSTANAAVTPTFRMLANPFSNNTANPSAGFYFQYQLGSVITNVLSIGSNGVLTSNGGMTVAPASVATASAGSNSPSIQLNASSWSSGSSTAVAQDFAWRAVATGNNTATPSANLALLFGAGSTAPAATGLSIAPTGIVNWASGQTFPGTGPGTITGITTSSPLTGSGTSGSVALGLNTGALETTLNSVYAGLGTTNTFTGAYNTFYGPITAEANQSNGAAVQGVGTSGAYGVLGTSDTASGVIGYSVSPGEGAAGILGYLAGSTSPSFGSIEATGTAGVWGDANGAPSGADWAAGIIGTGSSSAGYGGVFYNSSTVKPTVLAQNGSSGNGISGISAGGSGVVGNSTTGDGLVGYSNRPGAGDSGVFGYTSPTTSSNYGLAAGNSLVAGVWGDTTGNFNSTLASAGIIGTATAASGFGGYFTNSSTSTPAVLAQNLVGPGLQSVGAGSDGIDAFSTQASGGAGTGGSGVYGKAVSPTAGNGGILGDVYAFSKTYSQFSATGPGFVAGVWGDAGTASSGTELYKAGIVGTGDDITAGAFENNSPNGHPTVSAVSLYSGTTGTLFKSVMAATPEGVCGFGGGGDMNCTGRVKALVSVGGGARKVETYSVQSPENWIEDFGSGQLQRGVAVVNIDPAFGETVAEDASYHVFITPNGDAEALYVINKTATSFEVRESKGGTSSLSFDYRIVAKRRGYEAERLTDVTARFNAEKAQAMPPVIGSVVRSVRPEMASLLSSGQRAAGAVPAPPSAVGIEGNPRTHRRPVALPKVRPVRATGHASTASHP